MKTLKLKSGITALFTVITTAGFFGFAFGNTPSSAMSSEKMFIASDVNKIKLQDETVKNLEKQYRDERSAKENTSATRCTLMKARADLQLDKADLRTDKDKLMKEHQSVIKERSTVLKGERADLRHTRKELNTDLNRGNASAVTTAQIVVNDKNEIKRSKTVLDRAIKSRNTDLLAINKEIKGVHGQSAIVLSSQDAAARTQNLAMK